MQKRLITQLNDLDFKDLVKEQARLNGYLVYDSALNEPAAFPGLVLLRGSSLLLVETQAKAKALDRERLTWYQALHQVKHLGVFVWSSEQWKTLDLYLNLSPRE